MLSSTPTTAGTSRKTPTTAADKLKKLTKITEAENGVKELEGQLKSIYRWEKEPSDSKNRSSIRSRREIESPDSESSADLVNVGSFMSSGTWTGDQVSHEVYTI